MTLRAVRPEADRIKEGITVARAATILGCDHSTVRALIRNEAIDGWHVGKTDSPGGVRCDLYSVIDYQQRHSIRKPDAGEPAEAARRPRRRRPTSAAHREAIAEARALGIRLPPI